MKAAEKKPALDLAAPEIERLIAPYVSRRMSVDSREWLAATAREEAHRRVSYWYWRQHLFSWLRSRQRRNKFVEETYDRIWAGFDFAKAFDPTEQPMALEWREEGFIANGAVTQRFHLALLAKAIRALRPKSVLEVGSGRGINLLVLACQCPEAEFRGLELTESGVAAARAIVAAPQLPEALVRFMPEPPADLTRYRRIQIDQGSAELLPYPDRSFDLVFTRLALEQMEEIRPKALAEIARVAGKHVVMIESFREMNNEGLRRRYAIANNYFRGAIADLPRYGFEPIAVFDDWPHKITLKPVFVLARRVG